MKMIKEFKEEFNYTKGQMAAIIAPLIIFIIGAIVCIVAGIMTGEFLIIAFSPVVIFLGVDLAVKQHGIYQRRTKWEEEQLSWMTSYYVVKDEDGYFSLSTTESIDSVYQNYNIIEQCSSLGEALDKAEEYNGKG